MTQQQHVLIVDDEPDICAQITEYFSQAGFRVSSAGDGVAMRAIADTDNVNIVLLDLQLPGEDGLAIARDYLSGTDIPFIMLTSRNEVMDRVIGLEIGADDYVPKPFHLRELLARVRTVLRRRGQEVARSVDNAGARLHFSGWSLDMMSRTLTSDDGERVALTTQEFNLLSIFVRNPNVVLTRDALLDFAADRKWEPYDRAIDVLIGRLRRKIETDSRAPQLIKTVRGAGYIFTGDVSAG